MVGLIAAWAPDAADCGNGISHCTLISRTHHDMPGPRAFGRNGTADSILKSSQRLEVLDLPESTHRSTYELESGRDG